MQRELAWLVDDAVDYYTVGDRILKGTEWRDVQRWVQEDHGGDWVKTSTVRLRMSLTGLQEAWRERVEARAPLRTHPYAVFFSQPTCLS